MAFEIHVTARMQRCRGSYWDTPDGASAGPEWSWGPLGSWYSGLTDQSTRPLGEGLTSRRAIKNWTLNPRLRLDQHSPLDRAFHDHHGLLVFPAHRGVQLALRGLCCPGCRCRPWAWQDTGPRCALVVTQ